MDVRKLLARGLQGLALALACAAPSAAQDIAWRFGDEKARYDLTLGEPEPGAPSASPTTRPFRLLGKTDFTAGRPNMEVADPGDLIWYYALSTPRGAWPKKKRSPLIEEISDRFPLKALGALVVKGNHSARLRGKRATVRSSLLVSNPEQDGYWLKKGVLTLTRAFDLKTGRLESAEFTYEITVTKDDASKRHVWKGRIRPEGPPRGAQKKGAGGGVHFDRPEFHSRVQLAIEKGAKWLEGQADTRLATYKSKPPERHGVGYLALPCFALLRSGVPPETLRGHVEWLKSQPLTTTYDVSLLIMVLEALSVERKAIAPRPHTRSVARYKRGKVPQANKALIAKAAEWLIETRKKGEGWWSYFGRPGKGPLGHDMKSPGGGDRSNSQFAVLALHSALASGVKIPGEVWEEILHESLISQLAKGPPVSLEGSALNARSPLKRDPRDRKVEPGGTMTRTKDYSSLGNERLSGQARGWDYSMKRPPAADGAYGSMSAAGVSTLATAREGLREAGRLSGERREEAEAALRDGLAWLLNNYDVTRNPNKGSHYYYYAYSVEKAMDTSGVERLGDKEWWQDFAAELLARQDGITGSWEGNVEQTSFALLVLNRATLPAQLDIGEIERRATGERDPSMWDVVIIPEVGQLSVRQLLSAMLSDPAEAADRLPLARKALAALPDRHRPRVVPELVPLLTHPHRKTSRWARESLRLLAGTDQPQELERFSASWEVLRAAGDGLDYGLIEAVREVLTGPAPVPLKLHAMRALGRLGAVECVPDLIDGLTAKDPALREGAWDYLVSLAGGEHAPYSPAASESARAKAQEAWRAWWSESGPARVTQEQVRREIGNLSFPKRVEGASQRLLAIGKPALRGLVDGLRSDATRKPAHALLKKISGQAFPAKVDPWLAWLEGD